MPNNNVREFVVSSFKKYHEKLNKQLSDSSYISIEADPTVPGYVKNITSTDISNWNAAEANVQSDWNITNSLSSAYIKNKPTIPSITGLATETYVNEKVAGIVNSAPETLDTLNELAAALGNNPNFATTISTEIGTKVSKAELISQSYVTSTALSNQSYVTESKLSSKSYVTSNDLSAQSYVTSVDLNSRNLVSQQYLSEQSYVTSTTLSAQGYLQSFTETDPIFNASVAKGITSSDINNWNSVTTKESSTNKVTSISSSSTDTQYPSAKAVNDKIGTLDGSASIASVSNDIVTIKTGISESDGIISNATGTDIELAKIAKTGSPDDITVQYNGNSLTLSNALSNIKSDIDTAASTGTQYIVSTSRATTPNSTTYNGNNGTLAASATTSGKVYLVPNGTDSYEQFITTTTTSGNTTNYNWTSLGSTTMDLTGVAKIITLNGRQYAVAEGTTLVDLGDAVTEVNGQTAVQNGNTTYVHTVVNTTKNTTDGTKVSVLETQVKLGNVSTGTDGLATAADVKTNLDNKIIIRTWSNS